METEVIARHLSQAIRIPTVSHQKDEGTDFALYDKFLQFLRKTYPTFYRKLEVEAVERHNLLCRWPGKTKEPGILLLAHYDVVPAVREQGWSKDPFGGDIAEGYVWGRGAVDDKGNLIMLHEAIEELLRQGFAPQRDIWLAFGRDEEVGGAKGAAVMAALLEKRGVKVRAILDEGGAVTEGQFPGVEKPIALIGIAEKGAVNVRFCMQGVDGHSSQPPHHSAIGELASFIKDAEDHPMPTRLTPPVERMFETIAPHMKKNGAVLKNIKRLFPVASLALTKEATTNAMVRTTISFTMIEGGTAANIVPKMACVTANIRLLPGDTQESAMKHLRRVAGKRRISAEILKPGKPSAVTPTDTEEWRAMETLVQRHFPDAVVSPYLMMGGTDASHYEAITTHTFRFTGIRATKEETARVHGVDERISFENLASGTRFFIEFAKAFAG